MDVCRGCGESGEGDVEVSGDDGWQCSSAGRASHARVPSLVHAQKVRLQILTTTIRSLPHEHLQIYPHLPRVSRAVYVLQIANILVLKLTSVQEAHTAELQQ
jgi:hypothetical protein